MTATKIKVSEISPSLRLVNEDKRIKANTTPLAPLSITCGNKIVYDFFYPFKELNLI